MSRYTEFTQDIGEKLVELSKPVQDASVDAVATISETVADFVPELKLPEAIPAPSDIVKANFDLAQKLVAAQRDYVLRVLDAISPITSKFVEPSAKKVKAVKVSA